MGMREPLGGEVPLGYPRLAAFQSSESNFSLYRSFSYLHSRILLDLQDEIRSLEEELDQFDEFEVEEPKHRMPTSEHGSTREDILRGIRHKTVTYDEILIKARELDGFSRPRERDYSPIRRYVEQRRYGNEIIPTRDLEFLRNGAYPENFIELSRKRGSAGIGRLVGEAFKSRNSNAFNIPERSRRFKKSIRGDGDGPGYDGNNFEPISTSQDVWPTFTDRITNSTSLIRRAWGFPNVLPAWPVLFAFCGTASAAPIPDNTNRDDWKQRALRALTERLISCAFLVAPAIILLFCSIVAIGLRYFKKDGSAILGMMGLAAVLRNIRAPTSGGDGEDDIRFIELAMEMGYGMLMLVYCELIMLRNNGGKIFCFINICIAGAATLALIAFTSFNPVFVFSMTLPLSFALCDLVVDLNMRINGHERIE